MRRASARRRAAPGDPWLSRALTTTASGFIPPIVGLTLLLPMRLPSNARTVPTPVVLILVAGLGWMYFLSRRRPASRRAIGPTLAAEFAATLLMLALALHWRAADGWLAWIAAVASLLLTLWGGYCLRRVPPGPP